MLHYLLVGAALSLGQTGSLPPVKAAGGLPLQPPPATPVLFQPANQPLEEPTAEEIVEQVIQKTEEAAIAPADRWSLMKALQGTWPGYLLHDSGIQVYGWTEGSYTVSSQGRITWPILFQSPTNEPLLNQNWLIIERPVNTSGTEPTYGFRFDGVLPGTDARFLQQRGLLNGQPNRAQIDPYQFFLEAYFPTVGRGLDVKIGRVAVPYMAEVSPAVYNPLFSHSYAYYYNPFTHTGIMTTLKLSDEWSIGGWFTLGNDVWFDPAAEGMFIGTINWTSRNKRDAALLCIGISSGRFDQKEEFSNQDHVDLVWTHTFNPRMRYILDAGIGWERNVPDIGRANWAWAVNYLTYDFNPRLSATTRLEFFDDAQGFKTGFEGLYTALTGGVTLKPSKSLIVRPEVRYDYNSRSRPFGEDHGLLTGACDVIVRW